MRADWLPEDAESMAEEMRRWLSRFWTGKPRRQPSHLLPSAPRDDTTELAELAGLVESGDTSPEALERMAKLLGQSDPNADRF